MSNVNLNETAPTQFRDIGSCKPLPTGISAKKAPPPRCAGATSPAR